MLLCALLVSCGNDDDIARVEDAVSMMARSLYALLCLFPLQSPVRTRTPICYLDFKLDPDAEHSQPVPEGRPLKHTHAHMAPTIVRQAHTCTYFLLWKYDTVYLFR